MDERRKRSQAFAFFLASVAVIIFFAILATLVWGHLPDAQATAVEQWGTAIIAVLTMAAAYEWGSSKGSTLKDELRGAQPPAAPAPTPQPPADQEKAP